MLKISKNAKKALDMLHSQGFEAYVVGGSVRDMLMGNDAGDFDITTSALPNQTKEVFSAERVIETGIKHGTVTVLLGGESLEITTYRIDGEYSDNRHPSEVSFTRELSVDLSRRDFTVNALAYDGKNQIIDLFFGMADIENKIIRAIGEPKKRFEEDALRILRAMRFSSVLGFEIEENTKKAMLECKHLLKNVSPERIAVEINKFLLGKNVKKAILENCEILGEICPEFVKMKGFNQRNRWHIYDILEHTAVATEAVPPVLALRLTMLFHDTGKVHTFFTDENGVGHFYGHGDASAQIVKNYLDKYKYDNSTKEEVWDLVKHHDMHTALDEVLVKKRLRRMGKDRFLSLIQVQRADNSAQNPELTDMAHFDKLEETATRLADESCFSLSSLAVNGDDIMSLGLRGKEIGECLNYLLDEVIEGNVENTPSELLKKAKNKKEKAFE